LSTVSCCCGAKKAFTVLPKRRQIENAGDTNIKFGSLTRKEIRMKSMVMVSCLLVGVLCCVVLAQNASAPKLLWDVSSGQMPGDSRNATVSSVQGHTADGSGRSLSVIATGTGWVGEWCGTPVNWSGFERLAFTVSNSNDFNVSVYVRIKTVADAVVNLPVDLAPGVSTPVVELTDLKDISGAEKPVDLAQVRQWSINWNDGFEKPIYISNLHLESGAAAPPTPEVPKPAPAAPAVQPPAAPQTVQPAAQPLAPAASPAAPAPTMPPPAIDWTLLLCVLMVCVTAIVIVAMLRSRKA
jgi:hypothetical protein